ncbi:LytTR family two component transcriptional regulator [Algoriphagus boseongensis]|uniref:LytTR family two component transcriptional regulator n=1 Tax=Algoriphagus boseongensis TaxID=1442587 RepID=A0A4R6T7X8_9BACT|nr:LytTR family DNA-binding domain-containing protein [Algoriphagus boseongensis]TDQ16997.1 LytTR family two component transcriptional regulator [Algoriphagus boseongensis]
MKILIIEDEKPAANRLIRLLQEYFPEDQLIGNLDTISSAVRWLSENSSPDLLFCDIQLADGLSFEIFKKVQVKAPVIFTTAYDQYAIQAFQVNAIDYLLKPIDPKDLDRAVEKFKSRKTQPNLDLELIKSLLQPQEKSFKSRFLVRFGEKIQSIPVEEIAFFFSEERVTFLQTDAGKKFVLDSTLEQVENQVDPEVFFRINRKYLSRIEAVEEVFSYSNSRLKVKLHHCPDQDILISREKVAEFKAWLDR